MGKEFFRWYSSKPLEGYNVKREDATPFWLSKNIWSYFLQILQSLNKKLPDVSHFKALFLFIPFSYSTINPILYNVMSHRYRVAFRDTLCSRKRGFYSSANGFVRDQSSFRETTIAAAGRDHNLNYEGSQLVTIWQGVTSMSLTL